MPVSTTAAREGESAAPAEDPGEAYAIGRLLRARPPGPPVPWLAVDAGDDAAVLSDGTVLTVDVLVEGVHFDDRLDPADVGWKAIASSASDVGAMGALPTWALLTVSVPRPLDRGWIDAFASGMGEALAAWEVRLVGGDTTRSPGPRVVGVTMAGHAPFPVTRAGAGRGDDLWVTGELGSAARGFLEGGPGSARLRRPRPPVRFGAALGQNRLATAMMDLSDGLAADLARLCAASRVGALVDPARLPRGAALEGVADPVPFQVAFGDDYELLFTAPPEGRAGIRAVAASHGTRVSLIGVIDGGRGARLQGREWPAPAFRHFGGEA